MSSKALYLSKVAPRLWYRHEIGHTAIEVWTTTCVVLNFGKTTAANCTVLINPCNPQLSGVAKFPYFPRGGPVPAQPPTKDLHHIMGHVSQWGGMEVGHGMLFPVSVVDGLVHNFGGMYLDMELKWYRMMKRSGREPCPTGTAVRTTAGKDRLNEAYDSVLHTAPPFYRRPEHPNDDPTQQLYQCYRNALNLLESHDERVATPILGAGCRGFPMDVASTIASQAIRDWCRDNQDRNVTIALALLEESWAQQMMTNLLDS
eukprot:scaffold6345_cov155-Amphora_coffeaeformis.AAC.3